MKGRRQIKIVFSLLLFGILFFGIFCHPLLTGVSGHDKNSLYESKKNIVNNPPGQPSRPTGPTIIDKNSYYSYWSCSTDPDGDKIHYIWRFDDNCDCCTNIHKSGEGSTMSHCWAHFGIYKVEVMAMDEHGSYSEWSNPLYVAVTTHGLS
jgi:hypothetical protein